MVQKSYKKMDMEKVKDLSRKQIRGFPPPDRNDPDAVLELRLGTTVDLLAHCII